MILREYSNTTKREQSPCSQLQATLVTGAKTLAPHWDPVTAQKEGLDLELPALPGEGSLPIHSAGL